MSNTKKPGLLDLVVVLRGADDPNVEVGDVGTVVELLPPDGAEVEFLDWTGKTRCFATFRPHRHPKPGILIVAQGEK